jgi:hypothetical protein
MHGNMNVNLVLILMVFLFVDESLLLGSPSPEIYTESNQLTNTLRRATARTITRRHLIAEAWFQYWVSADRVCSGLNVTGTVFSSRWKRR